MNEREALAREVIVSAGNILRAAGFERDEIAAMFAEAARVLGGAEAVAADDELAPLRARFAACEPVRDLRGLAAEGLALLPLGDGVAELRQAFDLAMRIAPLLVDAQEELRGLAQAAGLPLVATLAERGDGPALCLEAFAEVYAGAFATVGALVEALIERRDGEAFGFLLGHFAEHGVVIGGELQETIARGVEVFGG